MFAQKAAAHAAEAPKAGPERAQAKQPVNPLWQALVMSVPGGARAADGAGEPSGGAAGPGGKRGASERAAGRFPGLGAGAFTIRRAVPVNVPHPGNQPGGVPEEEANGPPAQVRRALKVGSSDDPEEVEADQLADRIMRMPLPSGGAETGTLRSGGLFHGSGGRPLSGETRSFFEPRLGVDLGGVRLHTGPEEATVAAELNARAFAHGSDIWLGAGEHESDRRLMGHELTHVLQASDRRAAPDLIRRYTRTNTVYLWDVYTSKGSDPANVTDPDLRTTIEYEDYRRADLVWRFSDTVALGALRRSMDLFVAGVRGRGPNYIRSGREAQAAAHGLDHLNVTELGFTGDHTMFRVAGWGGVVGAKIDDPDGSAPVWTSAGVSFPVAYTKGTAPRMFAKFEVTPSISPAVSNVQVRAKVGTAVVGTASGLTMTGTVLESPGTPGQVNGIGGGAIIPGSATAGRISTVINFEISTDSGRIWFQAGAAPALFFFTEATPAPPGGKVRQDALDIVTSAAVTPPLGPRLAAMVQSMVTYNPSVIMPANFENTDAVMQTLSVPHQCDSQAFLMRYLLMTHGLTASVDYFWRGTSSNVIVYRMGSAPLWWGPSYQYDRPPEDFAVAQPHFFFHALTNFGGVRHDPTYGQASMGAVLESVSGATDQFATRATFLATPVLQDPKVCGH